MVSASMLGWEGMVEMRGETGDEGGDYSRLAGFFLSPLLGLSSQPMEWYLPPIQGRSPLHHSILRTPTRAWLLRKASPGLAVTC